MGKYTMLVVDDELDLRLFIKAVFETAGYTVLTAKNGREALEKARTNRPDIISLDLMMPGEGGTHMYRQLKKDPALCSIPVMIVSAVDDGAFVHAVKLLNAGSQSSMAVPEVYISKPPTPQELLNGAAQALHENRRAGKGDTLMAKKIMVVDDDPNIVDYLVNVFTDNGYETCSASDGSLALEIVQNENPDLITLDIEMPNEWGPRFYRKMSQLPECSDTPVIVISGLAGIHHAIRNAVATVNKPFDPEHVVNIVRETIGE